MKRLAIFVSLLLFLIPLNAAVNPNYISSYHVEVDISEDNIYSIQETIDFFYRRSSHGFYRSIPTTYNFNDPNRANQRAHISKIKVDESYSKSYQNNYTILQVGDANRTVVGPKRYQLSYNYNLGNDPNQGYDEFYFNLVGDAWDVEIENFTFAIRFPQPINSEKIWFSAGRYGSVSAEGIQYRLSEDRTLIEGEYLKSLQPNEALTVRVELPDSYFMLQVDHQARAANINLWLSLVAIILAVFIWLRFGKDDDLVIVTQFSAPDGLTPMDVGYIIDEELNVHDVTSMIFYWADLGYLTILEERGKFSFRKERELNSGSDHEKRLFQAFFRDATNNLITMSDLEGKFSIEFKKIAHRVESYYRGPRAITSMKSRNMAILSGVLLIIPALGFTLATTANYIDSLTMVAFITSLGFGVVFATLVFVMMRSWLIRKPLAKVIWSLLLVFLAMLGGTLLTSVAVMARNDFLLSSTEAAKAIVPSAIIAFFAVITRKRSEYGQKTIEAILGYREFIDRVEIDRLKRMIDEDPQLFYHVLSYAIVFGLEKKWARKFANIAIEPPTWYASSSTRLFNAILISRMLSRCSTALATTVITSSKGSPGSRFGGSSMGGGGFSGGGFGGGGGGTW